MADRFTNALKNVLKSKYDNEYLDRAYIMALCDIYNGVQNLQYASENLTENQSTFIKKLVKSYPRYSYIENDNRSYFEETFVSAVTSILGSEANLESTEKITQIKQLADI